MSIHYKLPKWTPHKCSTHLTPYIVFTVLLIIFLMLEFTSPWLFCNCQFVLLNPFTFFIHTPPIWPPSKCCLYLWVYFCSACSFILVFFLDFTYIWNYMAFVFVCLTYFTQHSTIYVHPCCFRWQDFILFKAESYSNEYMHYFYIIHLLMVT